MSDAATIDLRHVHKTLNIPLPQVEAVVALLDEGNTVPFITRYRKDQTGGLDEEQVRAVQTHVAKLRFLAERKQTILKTIEAQGKLTEKLARQIQNANTPKRLEDLYLPFKPKKQTLATVARSRGLEPLAREILDADPAALDLDKRAADFVDADKHVPTIADALLGAGHILAEQFSERADLRQRLREIFQKSGKINTTQADAKAAPATSEAPPPPPSDPNKDQPLFRHLVDDDPVAPPPEVAAVQEPPPAPVAEAPAEPVAETVEIPTPAVEAAAPEAAGEVAAAEAIAPPEQTAPAEAGETPAAEATTAEPAAEVPAQPIVAPNVAAEKKPKGKPKADKKLSKAELKKKKKEEARQKAFADYFSYTEELKRVPPHRVLAINRGERCKVLRVKLETDVEAMNAALDELAVPAEHPHVAFLRGCARDSLVRLIVPSLEREIRRELTERAETHAVDVFARNLRKLLLQPPVRGRRVLAIDPGFTSGCKLAAVDQFGNLLGHAVVYLIGKEDRRQEAAKKIVEMVGEHGVQVIVIGNGTACREVEDFIGQLLSGELAGRGVSFVIVNEAGASVYSTSDTGREEFPNYDPGLRSAISIGRRLQDPLSELVKIDPANIGVGLYQHDVKAGHLRTSLDEVVESCVNYVGVDVNTASPALLRYVSGLNQLTARRLYEHRRQNGPFRNRQQLKQVAGFGDATFVQSAGFLKISNGDHPLDTTWIHPESYDATTRLLATLGCELADLNNKEKTAQLAEQAAKLDLVEVARQLEIGLLTLKDILAQVLRPGRDPREDLPPPVFKQGVLKLEDLTPGMELTGTVLNVVDFGAFVDIGVHHSGLVHVSQLSSRYVRDPHDVVAVGDIVKVWVMEIDKQRRRVSLTMIPPGTPREQPAPRPPRGERPPRPDRRPPRAAPAEGTPTGTGEPVAAGTPPTGGTTGDSRPPRRPQGPPSQGGRPPYGGRPQQGGRSQQGGGPPRGGRGGRPPYDRGDRGDRPPKTIERPAPKKPVVPITDEMKKGKAPLRTFGDLMQFYQFKQEEHRKPAGDEPSGPAAQAELPPAPPAEPPADPPTETPPSQS